MPIAVLLAFAAPAMARADATLTVTGTAPHKTLTFKVWDALGHHDTTATASSGDLVIADNVVLDLGSSGCTAVDARNANCGPAADFERVVFAFGVGDDLLIVPAGFPIDVTADGGAGDDVLVGGPGDDELVGGAGDDYLYGDAGADVYDGGEGEDDIQADEAPRQADAAISCGAGTDSLTEDDVDELPDDCEILDPPYLDGELRITGDARVGNELGLSMPTNVGGDGAPSIQWERCNASGYLCKDIDGAQYATYTLTAADAGSRVRAWYSVENALGDDWVESQPTEVVQSAASPPSTPLPPTPRFLMPYVDPRQLTMPQYFIAREPAFAIRHGRPIVETGRAMTCRGPAASDQPCRLKVSARLRGRSTSAGASSVAVTAGASARVRVPLTAGANRVLRARRKLTLTVTVTITRPRSETVHETFTITVKAPPRKRR